MNVYSLITQNADPSKVVIQSRTEEKTFADLIDMVEAVCTHLVQFDVQIGERVAIIAQNSSFWIASYLGILRYGAVAVPVPIDQHQKTIHHFLQITNCQTCFIDDIHLKKFEQLPVEHTITPEMLDQIGHNRTAEIPTYESQDDDIASLMFTSGSTGVPNAVKVSHKNIITNTLSIVEYLKLNADDRIMVVLPFYYCFGTSLLHTYLHIGGSLVMNNSFLYTEDVLDDIENYQCTGFAGVPSIYQRFVKRSTFKQRKFESLRLFQQAGGRLSHHMIREIVEAFPQKQFFVMYGQTEATARLTYLPPDRVLEKVNSIGKAIPYVTIDILNEDNSPIQAGEQGEIVASGDSITLGYWHDLSNSRFKDNKLYTGDIATVDEDGFIYVVGRKSDFLKPGGNRFSSHKIADVLIQHPKIIEASIVGTYDSDLGEVIRAFVGVGDNQLTEAEVKRHCLQHLPRFAIPNEIIFMEELPKSQAGKIQKTLLLAYEEV